MDISEGFENETIKIDSTKLMVNLIKIKRINWYVVDFATDKNGAKAKQDFVIGKLGLYPAIINYLNFALNELKALKENVPGAEIDIIPFPKAPGGKFTVYLSNPVQMTTVVNARIKDPEAVIQYIDFMTRQSTGRAMLWGIEGEHYKIGSTGCPEVIDQDKYKNEVSWAFDYVMPYPKFLEENKCGFVETGFNPEGPRKLSGGRLELPCSDAL